MKLHTMSSTLETSLHAALQLHNWRHAFVVMLLTSLWRMSVLRSDKLAIGNRRDQWTLYAFVAVLKM